MVGLPATTMRSPDLPVPREGQQARCILRKPAIEEAAPGSGYSLPLTGLPPDSSEPQQRSNNGKGLGAGQPWRAI